MTKRLVMTCAWKKIGDKCVQVEDGEGIFVQYGIDFFEEPRDGTGLYTSAIVEMPDGRVRSVPRHLIRFWKEEEEEKEKNG